MIFIVVSGELEMTRSGKAKGSSFSRDRELLAVLGTGDMCGSLGFTLKQPVTVRVASETCEVLASRDEDPEIKSAMTVFSVRVHFCLFSTSPSLEDLERLPDDILQRITARLSAETAERLRYGYVSKPMGWQNTPKLQKRTRQDSELLLLNSRDLQMHLLARLWQNSGHVKQVT